MPDFTRYFRGGHKNDHPLLEWLDSLETGISVHLEVRRPQDIAGSFKTAKIYLHVRAADSRDADIKSDDWDDDLNEQLVRRHIKAVTFDNEKLRFSLMLKPAFKKSELRFGDGFFNSVLVHQISNGPFASIADVAAVLRDIYPQHVDTTFKSYFYCSEMIDNVLRERASELTGDLAYGDSTAEQILGGAISLYLDERFSVSARRSLGWLKG